MTNSKLKFFIAGAIALITFSACNNANKTVNT